MVGITMVPWERGNLLVWDATCTDTLLHPIYTSNTASEAGAVEAQAEEKKAKYRHLDGSFFIPVAVETTGVFGPLTGIWAAPSPSSMWQWKPLAFLALSIIEGPWPLHHQGHRGGKILPHSKGIRGHTEGICCIRSGDHGKLASFDECLE